ncbi:MAG: hypothetical protein GAK33_01464 [Burkholderia lata]|uniref:Transmembrane protein n=1 Tax=Burkholderia lata (strain ATCC 17760 / DSM 23089 / LMG 22485 / NCIMB 9086 / R18194 / 383) TaxID=482957 RepID=A0A833PWH8_BURL3|nr:hypothetical protein [Burkholderia lata]KAF1039623.1 MAG: hypothetical protein GAK33_01464 [Burkholderia lata]
MSTDHKDSESPSVRVDDVAIGHDTGPTADKTDLPAILLWLSGIPLWGLLALAIIAICAWPFSREIAALVVLGILIFMQQIGVVVYAFATVMLLAYAVLRKSLCPAGLTRVFWLQVLLAVLAVGAVADVQVDYHQHHYRVDPQ